MVIQSVKYRSQSPSKKVERKTQPTRRTIGDLDQALVLQVSLVATNQVVVLLQCVNDHVCRDVLSEQASDHVKIEGLEGAVGVTSHFQGAVGGIDEGGVEHAIVVVFRHVQEPDVDLGVLVAPEPLVVHALLHAGTRARGRHVADLAVVSGYGGCRGF